MRVPTSAETARRRVAHQALVASALLRVSCLRIRGGRARGNQNFYPPPSAPGFFLSCEKLGWELTSSSGATRRPMPQHACSDKRGNSSPPCCASSPCGVCIVVRWRFADTGRAGARQPKFLPPSLGPRVFPELREARLGADQLVRSDEKTKAPACVFRQARKQLAAVLRIKPLWRLHCCALAVCGYGEGGREATKISTPPPSAPGFFLSCEKTGWGAD